MPALALWRGQAYAEVGDAEWVAPEVARLEELRLSVVEGRCAALLALGAHEVAVAELEAYVQAHPLREHGCELLILGVVPGRAAGRRAGGAAGHPDAAGRGVGHRSRPGAATPGARHPDPVAGPGLAPAACGRTTAAAVRSHRGSRRPARCARSRTEKSSSVGRRRCSAWSTQSAAAADGRGRVVLVAGEPGIGKTRLLRRFAELAGVPVVWGACPEHVAAPPLWPWEQVLRAVRARFPQRPVPGAVAELLTATPRAVGLGRGRCRAAAV